ncbi:MAG: MFS transporter [Candidatus Sumerlaeaceae bacterium]
MSGKTQRWLNSTVLGIGLASFFSDLSHETVTSVLPAYLATFGAAAAVLGAVEGIADGASMVAKFYGGWLADRLRRRKPLCATGYAVMGFSPLVIAAALSPLWVIVGRTLAWVSRGLRTPARKALLADAVAPEFYGRAFGLERAMDTTGAIVAPLIVLGLLDLGLAHRHIIALSMIPGLLAALCITVLVRERPEKEPVRRPLLTSLGGLPARFYRFLVGVGIFGLGDFADTFYILYAVSVLKPSLGAQKAAELSVVLYTLHNVTYAAMSYGGGWLSDHINRRILLVIGYLCAAAAAGIMVVHFTGLPALVTLFALGGIAVGLYETVEDTIVADLVGDARRGSAYGALAITTGTGDLVSSLAVGALWATVGPSVAFATAMAVMLAGIIIVALSARADSFRQAIGKA